LAREICITIDIRNIGRGIPIHIPFSCPQFLWEYNTIPLLCSKVKVKIKDIDMTGEESNCKSVM
jgi:hypothetical protein